MLLLVFADGQELHSPCPLVVPVPHGRAPQHRTQLKQVGRLFGPWQRARTGQRGVRRPRFIGRFLALYLRMRRSQDIWGVRHWCRQKAVSDRLGSAMDCAKAVQHWKQEEWVVLPYCLSEVRATSIGENTLSLRIVYSLAS